MISIQIRKKGYYSITINIMIFLIFSQLVLAQSKNLLTLSEAIKIALKNNRKIALLQKDIDKSKGEKQAASRIFQDNPKIETKMANRKKWNQNLTDFSASLSQPIEIGKQRHYRMNIANLKLKKSELKQKKEKITVTEKIKGIWIKLTALNKKAQALQYILQVEQDLLQWLIVRSAHGEIPSVALNTVNLEVLETKEKLLDTKRAIVTQKIELEWVMNTTISEGVKIDYGWPEFPTKFNFDKLRNLAEEQNLDIQIALMDFKKADMVMKLAKARRMFPNFNFYLACSREDNDTLVSVGLSVPIPLFNRKTGEINATKAQQEKAALELRRIREKVLSKLKNFYESLTIMEQQKSLFTKQILPITQQNFEEINTRYKTGEINLMTLEKLWDNWMKAKIHYVNFLQEYNRIFCQIELLLGIELREYLMKHQQVEKQNHE